MLLCYIECIEHLVNTYYCGEFYLLVFSNVYMLDIILVLMCTV